MIVPKVQIRVIVFDYDGTLVDSNLIKRDAYRSLFQQDEKFDKLLDVVLESMPAGGRYDIIREMLIRSSRKKWYPDKLSIEVERLAKSYDHIATEGAAICPERPGATILLEQLVQEYPLYILSTTLEESLRYIVKRRNWTRFFKLIRGYPCDKALELKAFAKTENIEISELLMVGDSELDRKAAQIAGSQFLYLKEKTSIHKVLSRLAGIPTRFIKTGII
jgi:phosphoglycolate phosphatase-like HAD superfamily hydrolase